MSPVTRSVSLLVSGVLLGVGGAFLFGSGGPDEREALLQDLADRGAARIEEIGGADTEDTNEQMALSRFYRLNEFRRIGTEGQALAWVVPVPAGREGDPVALAAQGATVRLPRVAVDPTARDTWAREAARLSGLEGGVDARVFAAFAAVRDFAAANPWPDGSGLIGLRGSVWAGADVTERWISLNRALVARVDALLEGL